MTLNQLIDRLKEILTVHAQINYVYFGNVFDFIRQNEKVNHASAVIDLVGSSLGPGEATFAFQLTLCDWCDAEGTNQVEVLSDMHSVAHDFLASIRAEDWTTQATGQLTPFVERFEDTLAGWVLPFAISIDKEFDTCQIPQD